MNRVRDECRRVGRRPQGVELTDRTPHDGISPLEAAIGTQAVERYEEALTKLRPQQREAIVARIEMGFSYAEIAVMLDRPSPNAARVAVSRALPDTPDLKAAPAIDWQRTAAGTNMSAVLYPQRAPGAPDTTVSIELEALTDIPSGVTVRARDRYRSNIGALSPRALLPVKAGQHQRLQMMMDPAFVNAGVRHLQAEWIWEFNPTGKTWTEFDRSRHDVFVTTAAPCAPWDMSSPRGPWPWFEVLRRACLWATGASGTESCIDAITRGVFRLGGQAIDHTGTDREIIRYSGAPVMTLGPVFELSAFLDMANRIPGTPAAMNCADCASAVALLTAALGGPAGIIRLDPRPPGTLKGTMATNPPGRMRLSTGLDLTGPLNYLERFLESPQHPPDVVVVERDGLRYPGAAPACATPAVPAAIRAILKADAPTPVVDATGQLLAALGPTLTRHDQRFVIGEQTIEMVRLRLERQLEASTTVIVDAVSSATRAESVANLVRFAREYSFPLEMRREPGELAFAGSDEQFVLMIRGNTVVRMFPADQVTPVLPFAREVDRLLQAIYR